MNDVQVRMMNPLALAYIGDTVYDLYVRSRLVERHDVNAHALHKLAIPLVCAAGQAEAFRRAEGMLTQEEQAVFRRGRNARSPTVPKNADVGQYRVATGWEALMGYLFLIGQQSRIDELLGASVLIP